MLWLKEFNSENCVYFWLFFKLIFYGNIVYINCICLYDFLLKRVVDKEIVIYMNIENILCLIL